MTGFKKDQGDRRKADTDKRKRNVGSKESSLQISRTKKSRKEVMGYKRPIHTSRSGGPERKRGKGPHRQGDKRRLPSSANYSTHSRKRFRQAEALIEELDIGRYNLRLRVKKEAESRPSRGQMQDQRGPVQTKGRRFQESRPYNKDQRYK
ncbi:hypothetical protein TNIN_78791 [Trichonephila inaurata madagascariensis]|uniref:Uncharacterized protein n=1 Tax=Trichonephila inaurata madagascariensis TaxID=2747483 RepID=A0A8X7CD41_9ARAC|nr:hypothetical protein TNIN_78791 [Trichonephila inaurata madagascariensis]